LRDRSAILGEETFMNKGTYCLVMKLKQGRDIEIGLRPAIWFPPGYYCYVGSAMNSLSSRIKRHLSHQKRCHWHIDWFLRYAQVVGIKRIESSARLECALSRRIALISKKTIMKGFGASDCACETHLFYFKRNPDRDLDRIVKACQSLCGLLK